MKPGIDGPRFAACLAALEQVFEPGTQRLSKAESKRRAQLYFDALADLDVRAMELAAKAAVRDCRFFPKPMELREFAREAVLRLPAPAQLKALPEYMSPEQLEANQKFLRGLLDQLMTKLSEPFPRRRRT